MTLLARRYATALHAAAKAQGAVPAIDAELAALAGDLGSPRVGALLQSPDVPARDRQAALDKLAHGRHALLRNLFAVLQRRRRLEVLADLQQAFRAIVMAERGEAAGRVQSTAPLQPAQLAGMQQLATRLSGRKVAMTEEVVPELLGGVRLFVGNTLYDGSVRTSLDQLEQKLRQVSI
jgi:F-type H+-transporting ATPase subunit delta